MTFLDRLKSVFQRAIVAVARPFGLLQDQQQAQNRIPLFDWGPYELRTMLLAYLDGDFNLAEEFYEQVRRDGRIYDGLRKRGNAVTRYPQLWDLCEEAPDEVKVAAAKLKKIWQTHCLTKPNLAEINRRLAFFNVCLVYRYYRPVGGVMAPKFTPWTMRGVTYNSSKRCFIVPQRLGLPKEVPLEGNDEFIVVTAGGERCWIDGACVPLTKMFLLINQGWDKWSQHADVQALALRALKTPFFSREQIETGQAAHVVSLLKSGDTMVLPQGQGNTPGYELSLVESKHADAYKAFEFLVTNAYNIVAIILLGHNLTQETKAGSLAATSAALEVPEEISEADANVQTACFMPVFPEWMIANFSVETRLSWPYDSGEYAPCWTIDAKKPEDEVRRAEIFVKRATAAKTGVEAMKGAGVDFETTQIDWHRTNEACGFYLLPMASDQQRQPVRYAPPPEPPKLPMPGKPPKLMHGASRRPLLLSGREAETEGERDNLPQHRTS